MAKKRAGPGGRAASAGPAGEPLAESYRRVQAASRRSARFLHDDVGPLLTAAGLHLQLLRMDHPGTGAALQQVTALLDQAMDRIRAVSHELAPSPVLRGGLKNALERLIEGAAPATLDYSATAPIPEEAACALYDAAAAAVGQAVEIFGAKRVRVSVSGSRSLAIRIADDGRARGRLKELKDTFLIASISGISGSVATGKGTIVLLRYDLRRTLGGRP